MSPNDQTENLKFYVNELNELMNHKEIMANLRGGFSPIGFIKNRPSSLEMDDDEGNEQKTGLNLPELLYKITEILDMSGFEEASPTQIHEKTNHACFSIDDKPFFLRINKAGLVAFKKHGIDFPSIELLGPNINPQDLAVSNLNWNIKRNKFDLEYNLHCSDYYFSGSDILGNNTRKIELLKISSIKIDRDLKALGIDFVENYKSLELEDSEKYTSSVNKNATDYYLSRNSIILLLSQGVNLHETPYTYPGRELLKDNLEKHYRSREEAAKSDSFVTDILNRLKPTPDEERRYNRGKNI